MILYIHLYLYGAFLGIAIANGFNELLVTTASLFLSGVLIVGVLFMRKNPERHSTFRIFLRNKSVLF